MANEPQPIFNPSDDTIIAYRDGSSQTVLSLTIGEIKSLVNSWGYNTFILSPTYWSYYQETCYTNIVVFNTYNETVPMEYYVGDNSYIQTQGVSDGALCFQNPAYPNTSLTWSTYNYRYGAWYRSGGSTSPSWATNKQWNNIWYWVKGTEQDVTAPQYWCCTADIETLYINGSPLVTYQWSSVPAISGKNGILSLTEILNINDGNAVNDVALSGNISLSSSSRISAIISGIIQNEGSATVEYSVPSNIYSYIKLVYKQDKIPTSVNDGTAVDLDPTATSIDVMGFSKTVGTKYYLVIFTDKSTSDEYSYEVGNPPPRFSIPKKFVSDNGTFNYNIPSWIEDRVLSVLGTDPTTTTIYFDVENYPAVANLYSHQFVEYPLQFRTYYGTYPETGSRPATSNYIAKDYKLEWLWTSGSAYRDETDYLKTNGEWVSVYTQGSGRSRADNNFESFVAEMFILDHIEKKGYPAYFSWAHSENWSGRKYQCQISKMGTNSRYADLATAIYNALK